MGSVAVASVSLHEAGNSTTTRLNRKVFIILIGFEPLQNRAMGAMVAVTGVDQGRECLGHVLQIGDLLPEFVDMNLCQTFDYRALSRLVTP